jgi:hypothetical protein
MNINLNRWFWNNRFQIQNLIPEVLPKSFNRKELTPKVLQKTENHITLVATSVR